MCILVLTSLQCNRGGGGAKHDNSTITVLYSGDEYFLNPLSGEDAGPLVFLPLFINDENGELQPKLAERWEHSPDYRTWTIHLRRDVKWDDGTAVTAHDVKFSLELCAHPEVMITVPADKITVLDDFTFKIVYKEPSRNIFVDVWTVPIFDVTFSERQFRLGEIPEPLPFNPKQASQLLEEAGWRDINGDGIRERDGKEFSFSMLVSDRAFSGEKPAVYIQEQLCRVGVRIEITTLFSMLLYKQHMKGDFDSGIYMFYNFPGYTLSYSAIGYDNPRIFQLHRSA